MSLGTLYTGPYVRVVLPDSLVKYFGLDITISPRDAAFEAEFPLHQFPSFIGPKGFKITQTLAVLKHSK